MTTTIHPAPSVGDLLNKNRLVLATSEPYGKATGSGQPFLIDVLCAWGQGHLMEYVVWQVNLTQGTSATGGGQYFQQDLDGALDCLRNAEEVR